MQVQKVKSGYKLVKSLFGKYEEIPEEWIVNTINDIGKIVTGSTPSTKISDYYGTEFLWASPTDLGGGKNIEKTENMLSAKGFAISRKIPAGSVLFVCIGSTIGKIGMAIKKMATNQQINSVICKNNDPDFLYYQLSANNIKIKNMGNQVAVPILNKSDFGTIKIQIPTDIKEQQEIASILSNVDSLIRQYDKVIDSTKKLKTGLMQQLLIKGIGHTKFKKVPYVFQKEKTIPYSWQFEEIREISEKLVVGFVGTCEPFYTNEKGIPMFRTTNVKEGELDLSDMKYVTREFHEKNKKSQLKNNDLLVSRHGENGEACLVKEIEEANCLNIVIIRPKSEVLIPRFFEIAFNFSIVRKQIRRTTAGGGFKEL